jgi:hypothetical protein
LRNRHQRYGLLRRIVGFDEVAALEIDCAGSARDGRTNAGVVQIDARVVDCRLVGPDGRLEHRHRGLDIFELLRRCDASRCQFGLTLDLGLRALELSSVPFEVCLALRELRRECTIVEGKEVTSLTSWPSSKCTLAISPSTRDLMITVEIDWTVPIAVIRSVPASRSQRRP